jgi:hypothetical protein
MRYDYRVRREIQAVLCQRIKELCDIAWKDVFDAAGELDRLERAHRVAAHYLGQSSDEGSWVWEGVLTSLSYEIEAQECILGIARQVHREAVDALHAVKYAEYLPDED